VKQLQEIVRGKSVALVGNAQSLLTEGKADEIDAHDVVIRINLGLPAVIGASGIGRKHTVWVTAKYWGPLVQPTVDLIVFMKLTLIGDRDWERFQGEKQQRPPMIRWPLALATECEDYCQCDPGCGLRILWFLKKHCEPKSVNIYGMDCWETPNTWKNAFNTPNHNPKQERAVIDRLLCD
tara:strand:- start:1421 stop:1960 length:540 start_codon:yes stop_codon:yes gene_type:complete